MGVRVWRCQHFESAFLCVGMSQAKNFTMCFEAREVFAGVVQDDS